MSGTIVAIITAVAFVGMAILLATYGRRIRFPPGGREDFRMLGHDITVISHQSLSQAARRDVARALRALARAWGAVSPTPLTEVLPRFVLHFPRKVYRDYEGVQTYARAMIGRGRLPMFVMQEDHARAPGPLMIHEVCHVLASELLGHPDRLHADNEVWVELEAEAARLFQEDWQAEVLQDIAAVDRSGTPHA